MTPCPSCEHSLDSHNEYGCFVKEGRYGCDDAYCSCSVVPEGIKQKQRENVRLVVLAAWSCKKHRSYRILRPPRTACEQCWRNYIKVNP